MHGMYSCTRFARASCLVSLILSFQPGKASPFPLPTRLSLRRRRDRARLCKNHLCPHWLLNARFASERRSIFKDLYIVLFRLSLDWLSFILKVLLFQKWLWCIVFKHFFLFEIVWNCNERNFSRIEKGLKYFTYKLRWNYFEIIIVLYRLKFCIGKKLKKSLKIIDKKNLNKETFVILMIQR